MYVLYHYKNTQMKWEKKTLIHLVYFQDVILVLGQLCLVRLCLTIMVRTYSSSLLPTAASKNSGKSVLVHHFSTRAEIGYSIAFDLNPTLGYFINRGGDGCEGGVGTV